MCLAIPGKVVMISGKKATVDFGGLKRKVDISLIDKCNLNDYVLVHVGFAIQKVDEVTARETYRLLSEMDKEAMKQELRANNE
ncbi:MAG: HypC/HybG/HupF family hydrogenase formation chaperone [Nanoarchaeota archaeon]